MNIIILGAGQVGSTLAENLVSDDNDITIIDDDYVKLSNLQDNNDLRTIVGNASSPDILEQANAKDANLIIAVTNNDEVNIVACHIAHSLFNVPTKIARVRNSSYLKYKEKLFYNQIFTIDHLISPENIVMHNIKMLVNYPGSLQVSQFANGNLSVVKVKAYYGGPIIGYPVNQINNYLSHVEVKIIAIYRNGLYIKVQNSSIIEAGDEVIFATETPNIKAVIGQIQRLEKPYKKIMIAGGGNIGAGLSASLEKNYEVKLIERNPKKADNLASNLEKTLVFCSDASNQTLLFEEHVDKTDVFIALTSDDEANIMSSLLAKKLGAKNAMSLIQRKAYLDLTQNTNIDILISPQQATISSILQHVRKGDVQNVASLNKGKSEVIEIKIHGDEKSSEIIGKTINDIKWPIGTVIVAIIRAKTIIFNIDELVIEPMDNLVIYLNDKKNIHDIEKLFMPSAFFI